MNSSSRAGGSRTGHSAMLGAVALLVLAGCGTGADGVRQQSATISSAPVTAEPPAPSTAPTERSVTPGSSTPSSETASQPAVPAASTVTGITAKATVRYGDNSSFTLTVAAPSATPGTDLRGPVSISDGSTVVAQGTTDAGGTATLAFYNTVDPGEHVYSVTYGGNAGVAPATGSLTLRSTTTNVDISIGKVTGVQPGQPATIATRVIGTPQSPTGQVTVSVDGAVVGQGAVDDQGRFTATLPAAAEGQHEIGVAYAGDTRFDAATVTSPFTVTAPAVNPNQAGAAAVRASNPCPATAQACVDLTNEQAWLQSGGTVTYGPVAITSGEAGSRTRTGTFSVFWKDKDHKSSLFNNAPMPNSVFFDGDIAFHQGSLSRQSNGCIHLSWDASAAFFDALSTGSTVTVFGAPPY